MTDAPFTTPSDSRKGTSAEGDRTRIQDMLGTLVLLRSTGDVFDLVTEFGDATATPAEVLDCDDPSLGWRETLIFPRAIQGALADAGSKPILGVVAKVTSRKGFPMYVLDDPTPAQREKALAAWQKWAVPF